MLGESLMEAVGDFLGGLVSERLGERMSVRAAQVAGWLLALLLAVAAVATALMRIPRVPAAFAIAGLFMAAAMGLGTYLWWRSRPTRSPRQPR